MESVVELMDVCRQYGEGENIVNALYHVNTKISKGEFVAVVGASGSGKSTLLNVCGGLDRPTSGGIYIEGTDIGKLASDELTEFRRKRIGFIFQNYNLISVMSVYENIVLPVQIGGHLEDKELLKRIMDSQDERWETDGRINAKYLGTEAAMSKDKEISWVQERKVSGRMIKNIASRMYRLDRRRNITAIVAIALSAMLVVLVFSTIMSITALTRRNQQMMFGSQAESVYMFANMYWFEQLRDSGYFDDISYALYMGYYETDIAEKSRNVILYTDEKTAAWNFKEVLDGRWPQRDGEIVVDERFVEEYGKEIHVGDTVPIKIKTKVQEVEQDAVVCGICTANEALDEARVYVSEEFL